MTDSEQSIDDSYQRQMAGPLADWTNFLSSGRLEGHFEKESHDIWLFRRYQMRYFVLDATARLLMYYTSENKSECRGRYLLSDASKLGELLEETSTDFFITGTSKGIVGQVLRMRAPNVRTANLWFAALRYVTQALIDSLICMRLS